MKNKKNHATAQVRIYPSTRQRLKIKAAQLGISVAELIDKQSKRA